MLFSFFLKNFLILFEKQHPSLYARGFLQHSPQLRQLHKSHLVLLLILCIF